MSNGDLYGEERSIFKQFCYEFNIIFTKMILLMILLIYSEK